MKLLLDQNLSPLICERLANVGIESIHVRDVGMRAASDETIVDYARSKSLVIVSQDSDFSNLLASAASALPSLILLRIPQAVTASDIAALLAANLSAVSEQLAEGAIVSLGLERIRVRRLPLR